MIIGARANNILVIISSNVIITIKDAKIVKIKEEFVFIFFELYFFC